MTRRVAASSATERALRALTAAGCVDPSGEAAALLHASRDGRGPVDDLVARRVNGEPLPWIVGSVAFCDIRVLVAPGVFVPRPHTEVLARRAVALLPDDGVAVDLCTGSGVIPTVLRSARPNATVLGTDIDPVAIACARRNGVDALLGDLDEPLPVWVRGRADVVTAVVPYVPTDELHLLPRDALANDPRGALDGGPGGTRLLIRGAGVAARLLRPGGSVLLELGGDQADELAGVLSGLGLSRIRVHRDRDGRDRAIEAQEPRARLGARALGRRGPGG